MLVAADNLSAARPSVRRIMHERDQAALAELCRSAEKAGAAWLDINPGYLAAKGRAETWRFLINGAEAACGLRLMLDSPDPAVLREALSFCSRPPILNMAVAEPARLDPLLELSASHGLALVAAAMTSTVPQGRDERLALASYLVSEAAKHGISGERLILDPMIMPLGLPGGEAHASAVLGFLRAVGQVFDPKPLTMIALSNLTTSTAGVHTQFAAAPYLAAACGAGLDVAMLDARDPQLMRTVRLCSVFRGERLFAPAEYGQ